MNTRLVRILARKFANSGMDEEDLFQEGMIAYLRAEGTFDQKHGVVFEAYATRVIKNRFIDILRKSGNQLSELKESTQEGEFNLDDEVNLIEIKKILREKVCELERAVFNSYIEGFSYDEIGKIFELPRKKIDNIIQKVKRIIKENII